MQKLIICLLLGLSSCVIEVQAPEPTNTTSSAYYRKADVLEKIDGTIMYIDVETIHEDFLIVEDAKTRTLHKVLYEEIDTIYTPPPEVKQEREELKRSGQLR